MSTTDFATSSDETLTGRVKWFNNKTGYGFITITDGSKVGTDVFVHHSAIKVDDEQYRYLVQGEYVDLSLVATEGGAYEFQAGNVRGIKGGKLMCETRNETRSSRGVKENVLVRPSRGVRSRGEGPREGGEWNYVSKPKSVKADTESVPTDASKKSSRRFHKTAVKET
uniref:CSD domain-containing protein n=1 Tax=viral metagenome TaxID=1070528 RepID=A0A6C0E3C0_9ZZZZ